MQPLLQWKINKYYMFWVCIFSYRYPTCDVYAPYCHVWPAWLYNIVSHFLINGTFFRGKGGGGRFWTWNVCFDFLYNFFLKHFSIWEDLTKMWLKMYICLHVKYLFFLSDFNETWIYSTDFQKKSLNMNFHENLPSGSRVVPCGQTDMTKQTAAFHNFVNMPKIEQNKKWPTKLSKMVHFV